MEYKIIKECVPGEGVHLELHKSLYNCCQCKEMKCGKYCRCMMECVYTDSGLLCEEFLQSNDKVPLIFECNKYCSCSMDCFNRVSQRDTDKLYIIKSTSGKGMGLYSTTDMPKGTFIGEYTGEMIKLSTAKDRLCKMSENDSCYIILFNEHMPSGAVVTTSIDATYYGNHTRFINHSCQPNLTLLAVRRHSIVPSLCFFTTSFVKSNEELCFSYCDGNNSCTVGNIPCLCGSKDCIKFLPLQNTSI